jgi:hypothetical protein
MSQPLTLLNREDKGDIDADTRNNFRRFPHQQTLRFPSYFRHFCNFSPFLMFPMRAALTKRRNRRKHEIHTAAAIMAIV